MSLPTFKDDNKNIMLLQSSWSSQLNPVLANPLTSPSILKNISLVSGVNVINHMLGATPIGWFLIDNQTPVTLYRSAPFNELTLTLTSSTNAVVSLAVI